MEGPAEDIYRQIREKILREAALQESMEDRDLRLQIDRELESYAKSNPLKLKERLRLSTELYNSFKRMDVLQELLDDPAVTEIMINSAEEIFIEQNHRIRRWDKQFESEEKLEDLIQRIVGRINRRVNTASPIVDARLPDGSRVHIVLPPVALKGPTLTIRKFPEPIGMEQMIRYGTVTKEAADFLKILVISGYNLFISGGTSSGKSTFLNALSDYIPDRERVITIEDAAELQIRHIPNLVRLETRDQGPDGQGEVTMAMLIRASLRMRPDRIIVGEVRGREAFDMLNACNTGHDGSLSTGHANSTADMLTRLESMVRMGVDLPIDAIRGQIAAGLDLLIHLQRMPDQSRRVAEITEIDGVKDGTIRLHEIFHYDQKSGELVRSGRLWHTEKAVLRGYGAAPEL